MAYVAGFHQFFQYSFYGMVKLQLKVWFFSGSMDWTFKPYIG